MMGAVLQSSIILLMALCAVAVLRRQSAAIRHAILAAGMVTSLVVPALSPLLPPWHPVKNGGSEPQRHRDTEKTRNEVLDARFLHVTVPRWFTAPVLSEPPLNTRKIVVRIWIGGMAIGAIALFAGGIRISFLALRGKSVNSALWSSAATEVAHQLHVMRRIRLVHSGRGVLGVWGALRPRILLPRNFESWSDDRVRMVLTHEIAHIKRFDWIVQMLAELGRVLYWFNPLFWIACRRLRFESEHACDDVVLNAGIEASDYAAHLLDLAHTLRNSGRPWSPILAMAQPPSLERRFVAMLNPSLNHQSASRSAVFVVCAVAICLALPLAAMRAAEQIPAAGASPAMVVIANVGQPTRATPVVSPVASRKSPTTQPASARGPALGQGLADGSLLGKVYDSSSAVVPGVTLTVSAIERVTGFGIRENPVQTIVSDEAGRYEFRALTPGEYSLKAELPGFTTFRKTNLRIVSSQMLKEDAILYVGNIAERVVVITAGQPKPPQPAGVPQRLRVGGNVMAPRLVGQVKPIYPQSARESGIEGIVHLQGIVSTDGTLMALRVLSSNDQDLSNAALEAVRQWRYAPAKLNNMPIEVLTDIDVDFRITQQ